MISFVVANKIAVFRHIEIKPKRKMESTTALAGYLQQTMSPDINIRKPAENYLRKLEAQPGYALGLLSLLSPSCQIGNDIKLASAIAFKNYIKRNWKVVRYMIINAYRLTFNEFRKIFEMLHPNLILLLLHYL